MEFDSNLLKQNINLFILINDTQFRCSKEAIGIKDDPIFNSLKEFTNLNIIGIHFAHISEPGDYTYINEFLKSILSSSNNLKKLIFILNSSINDIEKF